MFLLAHLKKASRLQSQPDKLEAIPEKERENEKTALSAIFKVPALKYGI